MSTLICWWNYVSVKANNAIPTRTVAAIKKVFIDLKYGWRTSEFVKQRQTRAAVTRSTHTDVAGTPNESIWTEPLAVYCEGKQQQAKSNHSTFATAPRRLTAVHLQHGDIIYKSPLCRRLEDAAGVQLSTAERDVSAAVRSRLERLWNGSFRGSFGEWKRLRVVLLSQK